MTAVEAPDSWTRFTHFHEFYAGSAYSHEADVSVTYQEAFGPELEDERHVDFGRAFSSGYQWHFWDRQHPLIEAGIDLNYITAESKDVDLSLLLLTPFFRFRYQFLKTDALPEGKASVYAGIGLTYGAASATIDFRPEIPERIDASGDGLAPSYTAGALWRFTDRYALFLQYRYMEISFDLEAGDEDCFFFCDQASGSVDLKSQQVVAGLSFHF